MALGHQLAAPVDHDHDHLTHTTHDQHDQGTQWKTRTDRATRHVPKPVHRSPEPANDKHKHPRTSTGGFRLSQAKYGQYLGKLVLTGMSRCDRTDGADVSSFPFNVLVSPVRDTT